MFQLLIKSLLNNNSWRHKEDVCEFTSKQLVYFDYENWKIETIKSEAIGTNNQPC